jgi:hypothetical protein
MGLSDKLIAAAMKNLEKLLISKGFTAESMMSKFDFDGDGMINLEEFNSGLTKLTGSAAPDTYLKPIFSAIDINDNGYLSQNELMALLGIENKTTDSSSSLSISNHTNEKYNGEYIVQSTKINDKNWYMNSNNCRLYYYNANDGGAPSWSLDDREQNGSNDWYGGGWTRVPADGNIPVGSRRFVGAGKITISVSSSPGDSSLGSLPPASDDFSFFADKWSSELENMLENPSSPEVIDSMRLEANMKFEEEISQLPLVTQAPLRAIWKIKSDAVVTVAKTQLSSDSATIATGLGIVGAAIGAASSLSTNTSETPVTDQLPSLDGSSADVAPSATTLSPVSSPSEPIVPDEPIVEQSWHDTHHVEAPDRVEVVNQMSSEEWGSAHHVEAPDRVELPDRVSVGEPLSYSESNKQLPKEVIDKVPLEEKIMIDSSVSATNDFALSLDDIVVQMNGARFLNEQRELLSSFKGQILELSFRVSSIDRTFGIGVSEEYKGGNTLLVTSNSHEIEVRMKKEFDTSQIISGAEMKNQVSVVDWNGIRKRLVVNSY